MANSSLEPVSRLVKAVGGREGSCYYSRCGGGANGHINSLFDLKRQDCGGEFDISSLAGVASLSGSQQEDLTQRLR